MRFLRSLVCLLLLSGLARAKPTADNLAEQLVNDGWKMFLAGDLVNARARFEAAHQLAPNKAQPYRLLGLTDARLHHCEDALTSLDEFLRRIDPNDPRYAEAITVRDQCRAQTEVPPVASPAPVAVVPPPAPLPPSEPPPPAPRPSHRRAYIATGVVIGGLVVIGAAVGIAIGVTQQPKNSAYDSAVLFPPVKGM